MRGRRVWGEEERASKKCEKNKEGCLFKNGEERKERKERKAERMWEGEMREKGVGENVNEKEPGLRTWSPTVPLAWLESS